MNPWECPSWTVSWWIAYVVENKLSQPCTSYKARFVLTEIEYTVCIKIRSLRNFVCFVIQRRFVVQEKFCSYQPSFSLLSGRHKIVQVQGDNVIVARVVIEACELIELSNLSQERSKLFKKYIDRIVVKK
jgi:hypothetical protein